MGKGFNEFRQKLMTGDKKTTELLDRYGIEGYRSGAGDHGRNERGVDEVAKDLKRAVANDYDTRRTIEAAAMSGKKKANDIIDKGFDKIDNVYNAENFMRKAAERRGVKNFSSITDRMGLTQSMVERDRRKQEENLVSKEFLDKKLDDLKATKNSDGSDKQEVEYTESDRFASAKERLMNGTYDTTASMFKPGVAERSAGTAFKLNNAQAPRRDDIVTASDSYVDQYKADIIKAGGIRQARMDNLANAMNTVVRSDI